MITHSWSHFGSATSFEIWTKLYWGLWMLLNAFYVRTVSKCENGITARAFLSEWNSLAHILKCYSIVVYLRIVLYINSSNTCCCNFHCFHASLEQGLYMLQHVPRRAVHFSFSRLVDKDLCLFSHRMNSIWNVFRQKKQVKPSHTLNIFWMIRAIFSLSKHYHTSTRIRRSWRKEPTHIIVCSLEYSERCVCYLAF